MRRDPTTRTKVSSSRLNCSTACLRRQFHNLWSGDTVMSLSWENANDDDLRQRPADSQRPPVPVANYTEKGKSGEDAAARLEEHRQFPDQA